ncbi:MAG: helix-turn-helix domain-containing protein [Acidimicrobiales bacterium]
MTDTGRLDLTVLGHRARHFRKRAGLTLGQVGEQVGVSAPYLSQVENGHSEPRLALVSDIAAALGVTASDLLDPTPPSRRAELEMRVEAMQADPSYVSLSLPELKPGARVPDDVLEHLVTVYDAWRNTDRGADGAAVDPVRQANARLRAEMRDRSNYFAEIEAAAAEALAAGGYGGVGPISERTLLDVAAHYGFTINRVQDMPKSARSVTDLASRAIYIPQRNEMPTRAARSVVLSTLGHFALSHRDPGDVDEYLRQRVESNYFAGAVLAPESAAVPFLREAAEAGDLSAEDLKEVFYVSYEMATHRLCNLLTRHLDIPVHFLRTDEAGVVTKAYENDGVPFPTDVEGSPDGQQVPATWGPRQVFRSEDTFALHYQYTDTVAGTFWCVTHVEADRSPHNAVTMGTDDAHARCFRGSDTTRRLVSGQSTGEGGLSSSQLEARWAGRTWPSARDREFVLDAATSDGDFSPFPGVEMSEVYAFLERHASGI